MLGCLAGRLFNEVRFVGNMMEVAKNKVCSSVDYGTHKVAAKVDELRKKERPNALTEEEVKSLIENEESDKGGLHLVTPEDLDAIMQDKVKTANETLNGNNGVEGETTVKVKSASTKKTTNKK